MIAGNIGHNEATAEGIDVVIEMLGKHTLAERCFEPFTHEFNRYNHCPISESDEVPTFFGTMEEYSFVFFFRTDDAAIIERVSAAIKANPGWELYYEKNRVPCKNPALVLYSRRWLHDQVVSGISSDEAIEGLTKRYNERHPS